MPRPIHDETWSVVSLAQNLLMGLDPAQPMTSIPTPQLRLITETLISVVTGKRSGVGAGKFAKDVESRIEAVGKAQTEHHGKFAEEQTYLANKIAAEEAQA